ncbi:MAG: FtsX-like permease family protein [Candidatus Brocadiia bacterium]
MSEKTDRAQKKDTSATVESLSGFQMTPAPLFVGMRYLLKKKLSYLAIIGVAVSVGTLIVVMSVMGGFQKQLRSVIRGYLSDMSLLPVTGRLYSMQNWEQVRQDALNTSHVVAAAPYLQAPGLIRFPQQDRMENVRFRGMDPELEPKVTLFGSDFVQWGDLSVLNREYVDKNGGALKPCLIGSVMAERCSLYYTFRNRVADNLTGEKKQEVLKKLQRMREARTPTEAREKLQEAIQTLYQYNKTLAGLLAANGNRIMREKVVLVTASADLRRRLKAYLVAGVFETGRYDYDSGVVILSLESAMQLADSGGGVTGMNLKLDDYVNAPAVKKAFSRDFNAYTWEEQQKNYLEAVAMERFLMAVILSFVGALAGFCIFSILIMTVHEKRRDIGILKSVGYTNANVASVFLVDGAAIGILGAVFGAIGGLFFASYINQIAEFVEKLTGWTPFPPDVYYFSEIPADLGWEMPLVISGGALLCSLIFSVLPALKAARMDPIQTLRFE